MGGEVHPIHMRLRRQRARNGGLLHDSLAHQSVDDARGAIQLCACVRELRLRHQSDVFKNAEDIFFVILHGRRNERWGDPAYESGSAVSTEMELDAS